MCGPGSHQLWTGCGCGSQTSGRTPPRRGSSQPRGWGRRRAASQPAERTAAGTEPACSLPLSASTTEYRQQHRSLGNTMENIFKQKTKMSMSYWTSLGTHSLFQLVFPCFVPYEHDPNQPPETDWKYIHMTFRSYSSYNLYSNSSGASFTLTQALQIQVDR